MSNKVTPLPGRHPEGLPEVTEHLNVDKIQTGNADLPDPEWVPTDVQPGTTPLPVYPPNGGHVERRRGTDARALHWAQSAGLAVSGFIGLLAIVGVMALLDDLINGAPL